MAKKKTVKKQASRPEKPVEKSVRNQAIKGAAKPIKDAAATGPVAAYTMYGFEWLRPDVRAFWSALAGRLKDAGMDGVPARLSWQISEHELWHAPNLVFGQTCGYPLMKGLTGPVRLVATPTYAAPFVEGAMYRSLVIVGKGAGFTSLAQLKGKAAAINKPSSHSGYNAFRRLMADYVRQCMPEAFAGPERAGSIRFFSHVVTSGSHLESIRAVATGKADVAAIDAVSFHLISRQMPELTGAVRVLTTTLPAPGLPFITAATRTDAELRWLRSALADVIGDTKLRPNLANLGITGFQVIGREAYGRALEIEREAEDMGYPRLD
jgi:ABC-type phosphate/phosphonate transport system substrate-binding protein